MKISLSIEGQEFVDEYQYMAKSRRKLWINQLVLGACVLTVILVTAITYMGS